MRTTQPDYSDTLTEDMKQTLRLASQGFMQLIDPLLQAQFASDGIPQTLCHYTDFAGLQGILQTGSLWATDSRTLNDSSEQSYGEKVVRDYLTRFRSTDSPSPIETAMSTWLRPSFVTSFCTDSQVLSMWITYAARGGGYCLEFDADSLLGCSFPPFAQRLPIRITYGEQPTAQTHALLQAASQYAPQSTEASATAASWASLLSLRFKHPAFRHEDEWRIVVPGSPVSELRFRAGIADIKPYIVLQPIMPDGSQRLPLKRIVFGPTLRQDSVLIETHCCPGDEI